MKAEILKDLEEIKESPALTEDLWNQIENLSCAINTICVSICNTLETFDNNFANNPLLDRIQRNIWEIGTLADIINEKIPYNDLITISNIIHSLNEEINDNND